MENISELSIEEMIVIEGGRPISYYIGFAIGAVGGTAFSLIVGIANGLEGEHK